MSLTFCLILVGVNFLKNTKEKKQKQVIQEKKGRQPTQEEISFIKDVIENYHHNISIVLSGGNPVISKYKNDVFLSEKDEVCVLVSVLYKNGGIKVLCFFSGECKMCYKKKEVVFNDFSIDSVTKALKKVGIIDVGFKNN